MTLSYLEDLSQLVGGQVCKAAISQDGYPYLIIAKNTESRFFYVIAQSDAEGNGSGFLQLNEHQGRIVED